MCDSTTVKNIFNDKSGANFSNNLKIECDEAFIEDDKVIERLTISCMNANQRLGVRVHTWPFDDDNTGQTTIAVQGKAKKWSSKKCQNYLKTEFKNSNVIKCDSVEPVNFNAPACQCGDEKTVSQMIKAVNKAGDNAHPLTAKCLTLSKKKRKNKRKKKSKSEMWEMHCDLNGNGHQDEGEQLQKVKVNPKKGCKVSAQGLRCEREKLKCFCDVEAGEVLASVNKLKTFKNKVASISCVQSSLDNNTDVWRVKVSDKNTGAWCKTEEVTLKHRRESATCYQKLNSILKTTMKNTKC